MFFSLRLSSERLSQRESLKANLKVLYEFCQNLSAV